MVDRPDRPPDLYLPSMNVWEEAAPFKEPSDADLDRKGVGKYACSIDEQAF